MGIFGDSIIGSRLDAFARYAEGGAFHAMGMIPVGVGEGTVEQMVNGALKPVTYSNVPLWEMGNLRMGFSHRALRRSPLGALGKGALAGGIYGVFSEDTGVVEGAVGGGLLSLAFGRGSMLLEASQAGMTGRGWTGYLSPGISLLTSGYFAYQGYQENGSKGLKDAVVWDVATNAAVNYHHYATATLSDGTILKDQAMKASSLKLPKGGMLSMGARFAGAGIGASIGQAIGDATGLPGANLVGSFAGAYIGAAPIQFAARNPLLAGGGMIAAGVVAAAYGSYEIVKMGYAKRLAQRTIQTSGDTAAFMTSGANTMRARAVQAIQKSHMNARSALGQEANFMHYPSKNYFSSYRM